MSPTLLPTVEVEPSATARASVIFLHGLGADGHDFEPIVPALKLAPEKAVRFVFPHAPRRAVTLNSGMVMPAWFDIGELDLQRGETSDFAGAQRAALDVHALIEREIERGIPSSKIVVGGFSQGGALATLVALTYTKPLAGLITLSSFLPSNVPFESDASVANRAIATFVGYGSRDGIVPAVHGRKLCTRLEKLGCAVECHEYPMAHEVCLEEIDHWGRWLEKRL